MYQPKSETILLLSVYEPSGRDELSLNQIATEVYGRTYDGVQASVDVHNDTDARVELVTDKDLHDWAYDNYGGVSKRHLDTWLETPFTSEFRDNDNAPDMRSMLATLILDGHLPRGTYVLSVSW